VLAVRDNDARLGSGDTVTRRRAMRRALLAPGPDSLVERVGGYETRMREYANQALALSTRNARRAASTSRVPRLAFRTVLRVAEAVPPVKRRLFRPPLTTGGVVQDPPTG